MLLQIIRAVVIDVSETAATGSETHELLQVVAEGTQLFFCGTEDEVFLRAQEPGAVIDGHGVAALIGDISAAAMKTLSLEEEHAASWHYGGDAVLVPLVRSAPAGVGLQVRFRDESGSADFVGKIAQGQHGIEHDRDARAIFIQAGSMDQADVAAAKAFVAAA